MPWLALLPPRRPCRHTGGLGRQEGAAAAGESSCSEAMTVLSFPLGNVSASSETLEQHGDSPAGHTARSCTHQAQGVRPGLGCPGPPAPGTPEGTFSGKSSLQASLEIPLGMSDLGHQPQLALEQSQVLPPAAAGTKGKGVRGTGKTHSLEAEVAQPVLAFLSPSQCLTKAGEGPGTRA